jgi:hypothetical protein
MSTYSTSLKLTLIGDGEQTGTWGQTTNTNLGTLLEQAIVGQTTIIMTNADYTLTDLNGTTDEARNAVIIVTGNQNATYSVIVPAVPKLYMVTNSLNASATAYIKPSGGSTFQVPNGRTMYLYTNGTTFYALDYVSYAQNLVSGGTITTGAINCTSLTSSGAVSGTTITGTLFSGPGTNLSGLAGSLSIGGNAATATTVSTTVASGATGTTQTAGDNSTKMATTAYVATAVNNATSTLGTMATQNSNNVTITGGTINGVSGTNASLTVGNATNAVTAATVSTTVASGAVGTTQATATNNTQIATTAFVQAVKQTLYPIGSIYSSTAATNPGDASMLGFGTWIAFGAGRVMIGAGGGYTAGDTGGSANAVVVSHTHTGTTGGQSQTHEHAFSGTTDTENQGHVHTNSQGQYGVLNNGASGSAGVEEGAGAPNIFYDSMGNPNVQHTHTFNGGTVAANRDHTHGFLTSDASGGVSGTNANLQPYVVVYMWTRTV